MSVQVGLINNAVCFRYLSPISIDSCDLAVGKERFYAVIRCFEVIGFKQQVALDFFFLWTSLMTGFIYQFDQRRRSREGVRVRSEIVHGAKVSFLPRDF